MPIDLILKKFVEMPVPQPISSNGGIIFRCFFINFSFFICSSLCNLLYDGAIILYILVSRA